MLTITLAFEGSLEKEYEKFLSIMLGEKKHAIFDTLSECSDKSDNIHITQISIENVRSYRSAHKDENNNISVT